MKSKNASRGQALKLAILITAFCPLALRAGELPSVAPATVSGWHFGIDPMEFGGGADERDRLAGEVTYMHLFDADYDSLPGEVSADEFSIFAPILPLSNGRLRVLAFLNYRATSFDTSVPNLLPDDTLNSIRMPIAVIYDYSDEWLFGGMVMPGLSGDMENTGDAFTFSAFAGFGYKASPNLRWFGGVFYSDGFGDDFVAPGIGVMWNPTPDLSVNILPPFANVSWRFHEDYMLSMFARYESPTWNVDADNAGPTRDVNMSSARVGLRLERRMTEHLWAQVSAGYSFGREMEIENLSNNTLQKDDIDSSPFVQIGLSLRY